MFVFLYHHQTDINECNDNSTCPSTSTCRNLEGSHKCDCKSGYRDNEIETCAGGYIHWDCMAKKELLSMVKTQKMTWWECHQMSPNVKRSQEMSSCYYSYAFIIQFRQEIFLVLLNDKCERYFKQPFQTRTEVFHPEIQCDVVQLIVLDFLKGLLSGLE